MIITTPEQMREAAATLLMMYVPAGQYAKAMHDLRAIPIATQPVAVTVKPLVDRFDVRLDVAGNTATAMMEQCQNGYWVRIYDYEALSALTIHPADPLSDPRVVALVEVLALAQYGLSWASAYFRDSNHPYNDDPCPPVKRGLDAIRAALRAIGGEA